MDKFELQETFPASPAKLYRAWLDEKLHAAMTGSPAEIDAKVGGEFSAWDGYIFGTTTKLAPDKKIVQEWRTTEFPDKSADSLLELDFEKAKGGCRLVLKHSKIPTGQGEMYRQGWLDFYFKPMKKYLLLFSR